MPEVSRFHGIIVQIYHDDHGTPHFHARHAGRKVKVAIADLSVMHGMLPKPTLDLLLRWAAIHQDELLEAWKRAQQHEAPGKIEPLP